MTSWSECEAPAWLTPDCRSQAADAAQSAFPNETCGLFVYTNDIVSLHIFRGIFTPWSCLADDQEVIQFAYQLESEQGIVLASFHSHPHGFAKPSERDHLLNTWAKTHVIWTWSGVSWECHVFRS